jgi:hypothetical protein
MDVIPLLDISVAKAKFDKSWQEIQAAQPTYENIWRLRKAEFPILLIDVLSPMKKPSLILYFDLRDYDFCAPRATLLGLDFRHKKIEDVPKASDPDDEMLHIVADGSGRIWFCSPGFHEYHFLYDEDPWELVRATQQAGMLRLVERACNLIDRKKLN